ncbi:MAG: ATP-dependent metallopeptidase FtsH/Yme1/Tma family protein [Candidatus Acidiferrales bacterium]
MTFAPNPPARIGTGMSAAVRTILFWFLMLALAVVLWQMSSKQKGAGNNASAASMTYSDFMAQVDENNVSSVKILESPSTAEVHGQLRQPAASFRVTIPKESIPDVTQRLQKQGASIEVSTAQDSNWRTTALDIGPIFLIVLLWIFARRRSRSGSIRNPPASPTTSTVPTIPTNRPLG